jgi:diphthamide biosynthesis protein 2
VFFFQPQAETSLASNDKLPTSEEESNPRMILYVGPESLGLTNLLMTHAGSTVWHSYIYKHEFSLTIAQILSYDPLTKIARVESVKTNRLLMRRYAAVQRARDADIFGILIGTLGVGAYSAFFSLSSNILTRN